MELQYKYVKNWFDKTFSYYYNDQYTLDDDDFVVVTASEDQEAKSADQAECGNLIPVEAKVA